MNINKLLLEQIENDGLSQTEVLVFCFVHHFGLDTEVISSLINEDNEHFYRINYLDRDLETNNFTLKIPLFEEKVNDDVFSILIKSLISSGFTSTGHPNNQVKYSVLDKSESTRNAFNRFYNSDIDLEKLKNCIMNYYSRTEMPVKLEKFFDTIADIEYNSYSSENNFL